MNTLFGLNVKFVILELVAHKTHNYTVWQNVKYVILEMVLHRTYKYIVCAERKICDIRTGGAQNTQIHCVGRT